MVRPGGLGFEPHSDISDKGTDNCAHVPPPDEGVFEEKCDKGEHFRSG